MQHVSEFCLLFSPIFNLYKAVWEFVIYGLRERQFAYTGGKLLMFSTPARGHLG